MVKLYGQPVGEGLSSHTFTCPGSCSELFLGQAATVAATASEPVTVIREYLHMHTTGSRIVNEQIRNGQVIRASIVETWDFDQNGNVPALQEPFIVEPGDGFRTTCYYRGKKDTIFGLGSREEMVCCCFL